MGLRTKVDGGPIVYDRSGTRRLVSAIHIGSIGRRTIVSPYRIPRPRTLLGRVDARPRAAQARRRYHIRPARSDAARSPLRADLPADQIRGSRPHIFYSDARWPAWPSFQDV